MKSRPSPEIRIVELGRIFWVVTNLKSIAAMEVFLVLQTKIDKLSSVDFFPHCVRNDNAVVANRAVALSASGELARKDGSRNRGPSIFASKMQPPFVQGRSTRRERALGHFDSIAQGQFSVYEIRRYTHRQLTYPGQ